MADKPVTAAAMRKLRREVNRLENRNRALAEENRNLRKSYLADWQVTGTHHIASVTVGDVPLTAIRTAQKLGFAIGVRETYDKSLEFHAIPMEAPRNV